MRQRRSQTARWRAVLLVLALAAGLPTLLAAADYTIAAAEPAGGSTRQADWPSLRAALDSGTLRGGDRLLLEAGHHGKLTLRGQRFDPPLEIVPAPGATAHADQIVIDDSAGLAVRGLQVWPRTPTGRTRLILVDIGRKGSDILLEGLDIRGGPDAKDYYNWTREEWFRTWRVLGVKIAGTDVTVRNSAFTAVSIGVAAEGDRAKILGNQINGFSADALRGFGAGTVFAGNLVRDCFNIDGNHDDGFQSWVAPPGQSGRDVIRDITLDGNTILEWTGPPDHPLRGPLQGISLFDGPYENITIQNNLIVISAAHGIALYGGVDSHILHNTVVNITGPSRKAPWIRQAPTKGGTPPRGNVFAGNVAAALHLGEWTPRPLQLNTTAVRPVLLFEDPAKFDFRPRADGPLIDAGQTRLAPPHDNRGTPRPQGGAPDLGAYERR